MYKDRSTVVSDVAKIDQKKSEFVNSQVNQSTPVAEVYKSSRNIRPP